MLAASSGYTELVDGLVAEGARVEVAHTWSPSGNAVEGNVATVGATTAGGGGVDNLEIVDLDFEDAAGVSSYSQAAWEEDGEAFRQKRNNENDSVGYWRAGITPSGRKWHRA